VGGKLRRIFNFSKEDFQVINNSKNSESEDKIKETYDSMQRWLATPVTNREALDWMDEQSGFSEGLATITEGPDACGDCFVKAGKRIMLGDDDEIIVHAFVWGTGKEKGKRFSHAWTEKDGEVCDNSNGNDIQIDKRIYYAIANVEPNNPKAYRTYTPKEARHKFFSEGNWGHWDLDDSLYVAEEEKEHNSSIANAITEKFASDAQRRAAFANGYKSKGKKKIKEAPEPAPKRGGNETLGQARRDRIDPYVPKKQEPDYNRPAGGYSEVNAARL
jgi:hypothetical protein